MHPALGGALQLLSGEAIVGRDLDVPSLVAARAAVYVGRRQLGLLPWLPSILGPVNESESRVLTVAVAQLMQNRNLVIKGDATLAAAIA